MKSYTKSLIINLIVTTIILIFLTTGFIWIDRSYTKLIDEETKKLNNVSDLIILVNSKQIYLLNNYNSINLNNLIVYESLIHQTVTIIHKLNKDVKNSTEKRLIDNVIKNHSIYQNIVQDIIQNKDLTQITRSDSAYKKLVKVSDDLSFYYIKKIDKNNQNNTRISNLMVISSLLVLVINQLLFVYIVKKEGASKK